MTTVFENAAFIRAPDSCRRATHIGEFSVRTIDLAGVLCLRTGESAENQHVSGASQAVEDYIRQRSPRNAHNLGKMSMCEEEGRYISPWRLVSLPMESMG